MKITKSLRIFPIVTALLLVSCGPESYTVDEIRDATVGITVTQVDTVFTSDADGTNLQPSGESRQDAHIGYGILVDDNGTILTAKHILSGGSEAYGIQYGEEIYP